MATGSAWARVCARLAAVVFACLLAAVARADLIVPPNSQTTLNSGAADLSCTDVVVGGTLNVNTGALKNVRNFTIQPGGVVNAGSGVIEVGGNWSNSGNFVAGSSTVNFRDFCGAGPATISGNTTFFAVTFVSAIGRTYIFAVGSTQTITSLLQITGTQANPIQFRSSAPGQVAFIDLLNGGTQQIQHVGVTDVWATGQWLAPLEHNEGGGGNARRWFGNPVPPGGAGSASAIPTLDYGALGTLAALLAAAGAWISRQRTRIRTARIRALDARSRSAQEEDAS
jgi:hypothetical protein